MGLARTAGDHQLLPRRQGRRVQPALAPLAAALLLLGNQLAAALPPTANHYRRGAPGIKVFKPSLDVKSECPNLRIAVVNGVPFHFEVIVGLLHILRPFEKNLDVFLHPYVRPRNPEGSWDFIKWSRAKFHKVDTDVRRLLKSRGASQYDLVILVSPDYELEVNEEMVADMKPRSVVAIVHNSDFVGMPKLLRLAPPGGMRLVTLAPHVAASLARNTSREVDWQLATLPFQGSPDCLVAGAASLMGKCLHGFSMQGKFSNLRRNYSSIWNQVQGRLTDLTAPPLADLFKLNVLGKGTNRLNLPPAVEPHVALHTRLPFWNYYDVIYHTFALIPALGSPKYYTDKFSSTIVTSVITGTPMIVSDAFLRAYSMFSPRDTFVQGPGEEEIDVMMRVLRSQPAEVVAVRQGLADLRQRLNERAFKYYDGVIAQLCRSISGSSGSNSSSRGVG